MNFIKFKIILVLLLLMSCKDNNKCLYECPVINLAPVEAELKLSDLCEGYKIITLKGKPLGMRPDYYFGKKIIVVGTDLFDLYGNYLTTIGCEGRGPGEYLPGSLRNIVIKENSVDLYSSTKKMTFDMSGKLLEEKKYNISSGKYWNYRGYFNVNDEYIVLHNDTGFPGEYPKPEYKFWYYSLARDRFTDSLRLIDKNSIVSFRKVTMPYSCCFYKYRDTLRYTILDSIYSIIDKKFKLCYIYDRGKYKGEYGYHSQTSLKGYREYIRKSNKIYYTRVKENDRYLFCDYSCKGINYLSVYDKSKGMNLNIDRITDDLVFMKKGPRSGTGSVIKYSYPEPEPIGSYNRIITDDYLFYSISPRQFVKAMNSLKKRLTKKEWSKYKTLHKDVIETFKNITEESNDIIIGYRFKK